MRSRQELADHVERLLNKPDFSHEDGARCKCMLDLMSMAPPSLAEARLRTLHLQEELDGGLSREMISAFFRGRVSDHPALSEDVGPDRKRVLTMRSYSALNTGSGAAGEFAIPISFQAELLAALRGYDQILMRAAGSSVRTAPFCIFHSWMIRA